MLCARFHGNWNRNSQVHHGALAHLDSVELCTKPGAGIPVWSFSDFLGEQSSRFYVLLLSVRARATKRFGSLWKKQWGLNGYVSLCGFEIGKILLGPGVF